MILSDAGAMSRHARPGSGWWMTLRTGLAQSRHSPTIARLLVIGAMVEGLFVLDEYVPLLARVRGGSDAAAPLVVLVVWIGLLLGGEVAARRPAMSARPLGTMVVLGTVITTGAFVLRSVWGLLLIAVGYAALEAARIAIDADLQSLAPAATRATVTSVRGFGSAAISMLTFAVIGAMADGDDPTPGHFPLLVALTVTGVLIVRWLPRARPRRAEMEA